MIKVIKKAALIIDIVSDKKSISFSEIYNLSGLNRSTVSHILTTLAGVDYLAKDKSGNYIIGKKLLNLSGGFNYKSVLMQIASRTADDLIERINELTVIAMYHNGLRLTLIKRKSDKNLQVSSDDRTYPATWYTTANGKILLAHQSAAERERIISKIGLPTAKTWPEATTHSLLIQELDKIRADRFVVFSVDEMIDSIAVPVADAEGNYCFTVSCAVPVFAYDKISQAEILNHMREVAEHFSQELKLNDIKAAEMVF